MGFETLKQRNYYCCNLKLCLMVHMFEIIKSYLFGK